MLTEIELSALAGRNLAEIETDILDS